MSEFPDFADVFVEKNRARCILAKQVSVNKYSSETSSSNASSGFPERRITSFLQAIRAALGASEARFQTYDHLARITARSPNTLADWYAGGATPQLAALLSMLERLSPEVRHRVLDHACRIFPSIRDPRVAHDFHAVEALSALAAKGNGVTLAQGPEHFRTFVSTALANDIDRLSGTVAGLDIHSTMEFVPVPGVIYLHSPLASSSTRAQIKRYWPEIRNGNFRCIVLNGILSLVPALKADLVQLSKSCHVIVADQLHGKPEGIWREAAAPKHLIIVSPTRQHPAWMRLQFAEI